MSPEMKILEIGERGISLSEIRDFIFNRQNFSGLRISKGAKENIQKSNQEFSKILNSGMPIYGVTTGFGDSCFRVISPEQSEELQANLVSYLLCGTGEHLPRIVSRGVAFIRLLSLSRGFSGVSLELIDRLSYFCEQDWVPLIPREGSLGASGDLIPLAYLAQVIQGEGMTSTSSGNQPTRNLLEKANLKPYRLKPKEGLALVNGTSAMAAFCLYNLRIAKFLTQLSALNSAWLCLAIRGRTEAFGDLVNERAKSHPGQAMAANWIRQLLANENYQPKPISDTKISNGQTETLIQDRYSLRCSPQILGPVLETISQSESWLEAEINGTSDNPLIDVEGRLAMGGNFYGGYLAHSMDYLKISMANVADMIDRQLLSLVDDKSNRGLPPNLANWNQLSADERHLHHGLKGLHQSVSALTSEIMAKAMPNSIFSRSAESHNQDKVSLGMSAAVQCSQMLETLMTVESMYLVCLTQALDLSKVELKGGLSKEIYNLVRKHSPFVSRDTALEKNIRSLSQELLERALGQGEIF